MTRICITPAVESLGGMTTFRLKFEAGLRARGIDITHELGQPVDATLVIAGTRKLLPLWRARQRGTRIVQRLDGINWVHRKRNTGLKHYLRAEYGNFILSFIRRNIATKIIYQSKFSKNWWEDWYGIPHTSTAVIYNGVDLNIYNPNGSGKPPIDKYRILIVEGNLGGGYDMGLDNAIELSEILSGKYELKVELMVVGKISEEHKASIKSHVPIVWAGTVPRERIPEIDRSAHLLFSSDLNPACPNSVIEAMACGLPVVAFDTGAVNELVLGDSGKVIPYGSDPWKIQKPNVSALADAALEVLKNQVHFRKSARVQAENALGLDQMTDRYLSFMLEE